MPELRINTSVASRICAVWEQEQRSNVKRRNIILLGIWLLALAWAAPLHLHAQYGYEEDCGDECRINTNVAMLINVPANPTAQFATVGWGLASGVGWNINKRSALIGEFMWNRMYANDAAIQTIVAAVPQPTGTINGSVNVFSVTANYRFELRGRLLGAYVIGGAGWYLRNTDLSQSITIGTTTVCTPAWLWWGLVCTPGTVTNTQTLAGSNSNVLGGNAGGGVTFRVGNAPYRLYGEARYHYAPTEGIRTQFVTVAMGIRY